MEVDFFRQEDYEYVIENLAQIWKWIFLKGYSFDSFNVRGRGGLSLWLFWEYSRDGGFYDELLRYIRNLLNNSRIGLIQRSEVGKPYRARRMKSSDYVRALNNLPVVVERTLSTYRVQENLFVAHFVDKILSDIHEMKEVLKIARRNSDIAVKRDEDEKENEGKNIFDDLEARADKYYRQFLGLRGMGFLKEIEKFPQFHITSAILNSPLYAKIFQKYIDYAGVLMRGPINRELELSMLSNYRFFELYVLFKIRDTLKNYLHIEPKFEYKVLERNILEEMELDYFLMEWDFHYDSKIVLRYQNTVPAVEGGDKGDLFSISVWMRPDFMIEVISEGKIIVLDAKYKARLERYDIWQMHAYKDAIRRKGDKGKQAISMSLLVVPEYYKEGNYELYSKIDDYEVIEEVGTGIVEIFDLTEPAFWKRFWKFKI